MSEGSVFRRKDGSWCAKYKGAQGKYRYLYRKTKAEAKKALRDALKDRDDGIIPAGKMTVGDVLDSWLEDMQDTVSRRTWINRESVVRLHIKPVIGARTVSTLSHKDILRLYRIKAAEGLAPSSVRRIHTILRQSFAEAKRHKCIGHNPLADVKAPKEYRREKEVLTPDQVKRLLETARGNRIEGIVVLGATCALRVGEALSLRYEDVDFDKGTIKIRRTLWKGNTYQTKTKASTATLKMPRITQEVLKRHAENNGSKQGGWLFPTSNNTPIAASNFYHMWKRMLDKSGIPTSFTYHQLRHGVASTLLNEGVPLPVVSKFLRHANPGITASVYSHVIKGSEDAAGAMDDALG